MKIFPLRLDDTLHEEIRNRAFMNKLSIHSYLLRAISFAMESEASPNQKEETQAHVQPLS